MDTTQVTVLSVEAVETFGVSKTEAVRGKSAAGVECGEVGTRSLAFK